MKYYEFNKQEYYALIRAETEKKAFSLYVENVAGESVHEIMAEGDPDVMPKFEVFNKVVTAAIKITGVDFKTAANDFHSNSHEEKVMLIDSSLL